MSFDDIIPKLKVGDVFEAEVWDLSPCPERQIIKYHKNPKLFLITSTTNRLNIRCVLASK